jgi:hypothetical protein
MGFEKLDYVFPPQGKLSNVKDAVPNYWPRLRPALGPEELPCMI